MNFTNPREVTVQAGLIQQLLDTGKAPSPGFLKPFYMAMLSSALRRHSARQFELRGTARDYAIRMEVWEAAGLEPPETVAKWPARAFQPCRPLANAQATDDSAKSVETVFKTVGTPGSDDGDLFTIFHELIENCYRHSAATDGHFGVTCAQAWRNGDLGQIAIVDTGIGFRASLEANKALEERLNAENACELALEKGVSGKLGERHSGLGLALVSGIANFFPANLIVLSNREAVRVSKRGTDRIAVDAPWPGSVVIFEWKLSEHLDTGAIYRDWSEQEGQDDEFWF